MKIALEVYFHYLEKLIAKTSENPFTGYEHLFGTKSCRPNLFCPPTPMRTDTESRIQSTKQMSSKRALAKKNNHVKHTFTDVTTSPQRLRAGRSRFEGARSPFPLPRRVACERLWCCATSAGVARWRSRWRCTRSDCAQTRCAAWWARSSDKTCTKPNEGSAFNRSA